MQYALQYKELRYNVTRCISASATTLHLLYPSCHVQMLPFYYFHNWTPWFSRGVFLCPKTTPDQPWMMRKHKSSMRIQGAHLPWNSFEGQKIHSFYHQTLSLKVENTENAINPHWSGKLCHRDTRFWRAEYSWGKEEVVCWLLRMQVQQKSCNEFFFWQKWV